MADSESVRRSRGYHQHDAEWSSRGSRGLEGSCRHQRRPCRERHPNMMARSPGRCPSPRSTPGAARVVSRSSNEVEVTQSGPGSRTGCVLSPASSTCRDAGVRSRSSYRYTLKRLGQIPVSLTVSVPAEAPPQSLDVLHGDCRPHPRLALTRDWDDKKLGRSRRSALTLMEGTVRRPARSG
jgi:hypothetical protein